MRLKTRSAKTLSRVLRCHGLPPGSMTTPAASASIKACCVWRGQAVRRAADGAGCQPVHATRHPHRRTPGTAPGGGEVRRSCPDSAARWSQEDATGPQHRRTPVGVVPDDDPMILNLLSDQRNEFFGDFSHTACHLWLLRSWLWTAKQSSVSLPTSQANTRTIPGPIWSYRLSRPQELWQVSEYPTPHGWSLYLACRLRSHTAFFRLEPWLWPTTHKTLRIFSLHAPVEIVRIR